MNWKNMMNKNNWVFQQVELIESNVCLENPGRGWYGIYTFVVQDSINPEELRWSLRDGELLALVLLDISIYRSMQLDENALNNIRSILSFFMYYKKDVILRPVYDREGKGRECEPDSFEQVLEHLQQIGGLLRDMQHSVFIFQGMLAGSWGEMHDSRYLSPECINRMWNCMRQYLRDGELLALVLLDISIYRSMQLDENALNNIRSILSFFMYYKKDVILRPVYDREGKGRECEPDSFEQVLEHLQQIGGLLRDMQHSVFIFQGMLAGSWGEMHDSRYLSPECINRMWNCMRQYLGDEIYLAVRTPAQWRTLRSEKEFRQKKYAHLALFDDGILGSMTHLGTFGTELREAAGWAQAWTRKEEMEFVNCLTEDMPCGGEVVACTENDRMYEAKFIVNELKKMHITYLDSTHDMKALDLWKSISWDGFDNLKIWKGYSLYEYIGEHLGYRLVVRTVELKPIRRGRAEFMFEIENTGFGRVFQETELFLIMKNRNETREVPISMDMRKIQAGTRICGKTVIKLMEGRVSLKLQRKKDGRIIHFANKNSTDTLYLGSLHCGKIYLSEE